MWEREVLCSSRIICRGDSRVKTGDTFSKWKGVKRAVPQGSFLGPVFFFLIYALTTCFFRLRKVKDDHQLYSSDVDKVALEKYICQLEANEWYRNNRMIVNETKHQAIALGKTGHSSFH